MKLSVAATLAAPAAADDPEHVSKLIKWSDDLIEDSGDEGQTWQPSLARNCCWQVLLWWIPY
jgi:hypothetical protein